MFIAEQQMVAAAVGMPVRGKRPFASTFAAFLSRAYDYPHGGDLHATIRLSGSHAGVSIGEDGPSQMALEDLAMMRAVHGSTVLYPCDPNQTAQLVAAMADLGISFLRTTREVAGGTRPARSSRIGGCVVSRAGDQVAVVAAASRFTRRCGAEALAAEGVAVR